MAIVFEQSSVNLAVCSTNFVTQKTHRSVNLVPRITMENKRPQKKAPESGNLTKKQKKFPKFQNEILFVYEAPSGRWRTRLLPAELTQREVGLVLSSGSEILWTNIRSLEIEEFC